MKEKYFVETEKNKALRLKITERCPWSCIFCHKEGGWDIDDINWDQETERVIQTIRDVIGIEEIHYTGGEPTSNKGISELTTGLVSLGLDVKTTSNAQLSKKALKK